MRATADFHPRRYTIRNLFRRLARSDDRWAGLRRHARSLDAAKRRLEDVAA